jgi:tetratricopeptide (TPR) repeat protein
MSAGFAPLRVERVLRLLPDVDALAPLRAVIVATSKGRSEEEPDRTVGKRYVRAGEFEELVGRAVDRVTEHLRALYAAAIEALEAEERGDASAAVRAFLRAGDREEAAGRDAEARMWYDHARRIAEELRDRRPEIETLHRLGHLDAAHGSLDRASRVYQRSLALADAEGDPAGAALACEGLGEVALIEGKAHGAAAWYARGRGYAEPDRALVARLDLGLAEVAMISGALDDAAAALDRAGRVLEEEGDCEPLVRLLDAWGRLETLRGRHTDALVRYREALARLRGTERSPRLEMDIRLHICRLHLEAGRLPVAEDEIRRAEDLAIVHNLTRQLARLYVMMGQVRGAAGDETGFVFFEKAIELSRGREASPRLEGEAYLEYGRFRRAFGDHDESRAYLERAREIFDAQGDRPMCALIDSELSGLPAWHEAS